jgi:cysteine desulfurase
MHANNEICTIQPMAEIGEICHGNGVLFLVDASQTFGKLDIDVNALHIDLLAATAHKIYGPKGIGLLYVNGKNPKVKMTSQITGGGHEYGLRSGTLPVHQVVGFGKAIEICDPNENEKLAILQKMLIDGIVAAHPDVQLNGSREYGLENNINASFSGLDAETIIGKMKGIACSTGSACSTANLEPSHVLKAIGLKNEMAHSSIRFSLGRFNTKEEIINAIDEINRIVSEMKDKSPRNL